MTPLRAAARVLVCAALLAPPQRAPATPAPAPSCDLISPGFVVTYDPTSDVAKSSVSKIEIDCTSTVALSVQVDLSPGRSGDYGDRTALLMGGGGVLHYNLLYGTTLTPFGDGSPGTQHLQTTAAPSGNSITIEQSIRLLLAPHQFAVPGRYSDALMVTVQF